MMGALAAGGISGPVGPVTKEAMRSPVKNGFTLIEILVSFSIVTILIGLLYGTFRATTDTAEDIENNADPYRISRIAFYQITKDLSMFSQKDIAPAAGSPSSLGPETAFGSLRLLGENRSRFIEGSNYPNDTISFLSLAAPPVLRGFSESDRVEITYSLSEESLIRKAKFRDKPVLNEVGESVLGLNMRYFDRKKQEWVDEWDPRLTDGIPLAMEVTLILKGHSPIKERIFRTTVEINS